MYPHPPPGVNTGFDVRVLFSPRAFVSRVFPLLFVMGCGSTRGLGGARSTAAQAAMRLIPAGALESAGRPGAWQTVELRGFAIDRAQVTVRDYWDLVASRRVPVPAADAEEGVAEALRRAHAWAGTDPPAAYLAHPMVGVSHDEARAFCAWRGARLPTATEWERALYGGDRRPFPWGEVADPARVNSSEFGAGDTAPVLTHSRAQGPFEVADGVGNVREWTDTPGDRPGAWVVAGSSWREPLRAREPGPPLTRDGGARSLTIGFRCVRDVGP